MIDNQQDNIWVLSCEATKQNETLSQRYECCVVVCLEDHHQLDEKISDVLKEDGYLFLYSGLAKPIIQHLEESDHYDQTAIDLSQKVSRQQPIVFKETKLLSSKKLALDIDYLEFSEVSIPPAVDQSWLAFWEKPWINDTLKSLLFSQPKHQPPENLLRTYLILDAQAYSSIRGLFDLDLLNTQTIQCLYKGDAAKTLKYCAPYLIDMTLENIKYDSLREEIIGTPDFHRDYFKKYWGHNTGIFIRTTASFEEVHQHFRKFTRVYDEVEDKWVFFHFYSPTVVDTYFQSIWNWAQRCKLFFISRDNEHQFTLLSELEEGQKILTIQVNPGIDIHSMTAPPFIITARDKAGLQEKKVRDNCRKMADELKMLYPESLNNLTDIEARVFASVTRMQSYGFTAGEHLFQLAAFELFYGCDYESKYANADLYKICTSEQAEADKFKQFMDYITQLTVNKDAYE